MSDERFLRYCALAIPGFVIDGCALYKRYVPPRYPGHDYSNFFLTLIILPLALACGAAAFWMLGNDWTGYKNRTRAGAKETVYRLLAAGVITTVPFVLFLYA